MFSPTCIQLAIAVKRIGYFATGCFLIQLSNDKIKNYAEKSDAVLKNLSEVNEKGVSAMTLDTIEFTTLAVLLIVGVGNADLCERPVDLYTRNLCRLFKLEHMRREFELSIDLTKVCISDTSPTDYEQGLGDVEMT